MTSKDLLSWFAIALVVRLAAIGWLGAAAHGTRTAHHEHASIARSLAEGNGFRFNFFGRLDEFPVKTSQQAPLVPGLLAASYLLLGIESEAAFTALLAVEATLGALAVLCLASWAAERGGRRLGIGTALAGAFYPPLLASSLHVQAVAFNLAWVAILLWAADDTGSRLRQGIFGLAGVAALLTDPILAAVIGPLLLHRMVRQWKSMPAADAGERLKSLRRSVALPVATMVVGLLPWTVRNYLVHGRLILVKDSFCYVFWQGNNVLSVGTDKLPVLAEDAGRLGDMQTFSASQQAATAARDRSESVNGCLSPEFIAALQAMPTERERMDAFRPLAIDAVIGHPIRYLTRCGQRAIAWFWFDPTNPRSFLLAYRVSYWSLLLLAVLGWQRLPAGRWSPLVVSLVGLSTVHLLVITSARFRLPAELLLLPLAGNGLLYGAVAIAHVGRLLTRWPRFQTLLPNNG